MVTIKTFGKDKSVLTAFWLKRIKAGIIRSKPGRSIFAFKYQIYLWTVVACCVRRHRLENGVSAQISASEIRQYLCLLKYFIVFATMCAAAVFYRSASIHKGELCSVGKLYTLVLVHWVLVHSYFIKRLVKLDWKFSLLLDVCLHIYKLFNYLQISVINFGQFIISVYTGYWLLLQNTSTNNLEVIFFWVIWGFSLFCIWHCIFLSHLCNSSILARSVKHLYYCLTI